MSHCVQVTGATWWAAMRIVVGVGDLVQRTGNDQAQVEYSVAGRSRDRVTLCTVCTLHEETSTGFLVWPQNQGQWFVNVLASKPLGRVSWFKTKVNGLSVVLPQNHWDGFSGLGLKTDSYGLVIWASKSSRQFLGLGLKTKWDTVCRLHHKTDGRIKMVWSTRRDLAACFVWKHVRLRFLSLASRLVEAQRRCCMWHHRGDCIELKLKTDRSMWRATSNPSTPTLLFSMY
jgi:hypothetical protein